MQSISIESLILSQVYLKSVLLELRYYDNLTNEYTNVIHQLATTADMFCNSDTCTVSIRLVVFFTDTQAEKHVIRLLQTKREKEHNLYINSAALLQQGKQTRCLIKLTSFSTVCNSADATSHCTQSYTHSISDSYYFTNYFS